MEAPMAWAATRAAEWAKGLWVMLREERRYGVVQLNKARVLAIGRGLLAPGSRGCPPISAWRTRSTEATRSVRLRKGSARVYTQGTGRRNEAVGEARGLRLRRRTTTGK